MKYKEKLIISGDIIEHFIYEKPMECDYKILDKERSLGRQNDASDEQKILNRYKVQQRAKTQLRRLINANAWQWLDSKGRPFPPKFVTLTFAENITNLKEANPEYKNFIKRLNYYIGYGVQYNVVVEFQNRGAVHYHVVFYNIPYIPAQKLSELWGQGFIKINQIKDVDNVGAYVSKYMGKDLNEDKLIGEKCYFSSRGLKKPKEVKEKNQVQRIASALPDSCKKYQSEFENDYTGKVQYAQYNLTDWENVSRYRRISNKAR